jgi:hypothetical protein
VTMGGNDLLTAYGDAVAARRAGAHPAGRGALRGVRALCKVGRALDHMGLCTIGRQAVVAA